MNMNVITRSFSTINGDAENNIVYMETKGQ
jgi:hypothetical protein